MNCDFELDFLQNGLRQDNGGNLRPISVGCRRRKKGHSLLAIDPIARPDR